MSAAHSNEQAEGSTMLALLQGGRASGETAQTEAAMGHGYMKLWCFGRSEQNAAVFTVNMINVTSV